MSVSRFSNLNLEGFFNRLPGALAMRVLDAYVGAPRRDWSAEALALEKAAGNPWSARNQEMARTRAEGTRPSLPLRLYAGTYVDPAFGEVTVVEERDALVLRFPPATAGELEHWHHDVFRVNWRLRDPPSGCLNPDALATFALDPAGTVNALRIDRGVGEFKRFPLSRKRVSREDGISSRREYGREK